MSVHALGSGPIRTLLALIRVHRAEGRATVRDVAAARGRAVSTVYPQLLELRDAGLVDWELGRSATLHPTVEVVP